MSEAGDVYSVVTTNTDRQGADDHFLKTETGMKGFEEELVALADASVKHTSLSPYVQRPRCTSPPLLPR